MIAALDERLGGAPPRPSLHQRLDRLEAELQRANRALGESLLDRRLATLATATDPALPGDTARFLAWAEGHEGPAARAGLWFNPPVACAYSETGVDVLLVNERIVEQPYVFGALAQLPRSARILDVGGAESTVAVSLASLGHEVQVVDPRGYRLGHPSLQRHALALDELPHEQPFDAAIALSCIEHFGLGGYGGARAAGRDDCAALADLHQRLVPGGLLVLTVPLAAHSTEDHFQRIYSPWEIVDFSAAWRRDHHTWTRGVPDDPGADLGVALVTARASRA